MQSREVVPAGSLDEHVIVSPEQTRGRVAARRTADTDFISPTEGLGRWVHRNSGLL